MKNMSIYPVRHEYFPECFASAGNTLPQSKDGPSSPVLDHTTFMCPFTDVMQGIMKLSPSTAL